MTSSEQAKGDDQSRAANLWGWVTGLVFAIGLVAALGAYGPEPGYPVLRNGAAAVALLSFVILAAIAVIWAVLGLILDLLEIEG